MHYLKTIIYVIQKHTTLYDKSQSILSVSLYCQVFSVYIDISRRKGAREREREREREGQNTIDKHRVKNKASKSVRLPYFLTI